LQAEGRGLAPVADVYAAAGETVARFAAAHSRL
jgi:hypothetical protein